MHVVCCLISFYSFRPEQSFCFKYEYSSGLCIFRLCQKCSSSIIISKKSPQWQLFISFLSQCIVSLELCGKFTQEVMPQISNFRVFVVFRQGRGYVTSFLIGLVSLCGVSILTVWLCVCMRKHKHRQTLLLSWATARSQGAFRSRQVKGQPRHKIRVSDSMKVFPTSAF